MKITIDEDVVKKTSTPDGVTLTVPEVLACLLSQVCDNAHDLISDLEDRGILIHEPSMFHPRIRPFRKYIDLTNRILLLSDKSLPTENELTPLAYRLKEIYPKGRRSPTITWQDGLTATVDRLKGLYKNFPEIKNYTHEEILEATKRYVELFEQDRTFMRTLSYFLWKKTDSLSSDLIKMLENPDSTASDFYDSVELM